MQSYQRLEASIREHNYVSVPFYVSHVEYKAAIEAFFNFLALPLVAKEGLFFKAHPLERGAEVGYRRYLRDQGKTDNRQYFHYHRLAEEHFFEARRAVPELDALLRAMKPIHDAAVRAFETIFLEFDRPFPGLYQKFFSEKRPGDFYLRFLAYDRAEPGAFLAKGHYDRGCCTLALAESAPGLRLGIDAQHLKSVAHREGEALFFPGLKFADITSPAFAPAWHDVVQKDEDAFDAETARWAIVCFADPAEMAYASYEEAHALS